MFKQATKIEKGVKTRFFSFVQIRMSPAGIESNDSKCRGSQSDADSDPVRDKIKKKSCNVPYLASIF